MDEAGGGDPDWVSPEDALLCFGRLGLPEAYLWLPAGAHRDRLRQVLQWDLHEQLRDGEVQARGVPAGRSGASEAIPASAWRQGAVTQWSGRDGGAAELNSGRWTRVVIGSKWAGVLPDLTLLAAPLPQERGVTPRAALFCLIAPDLSAALLDAYTADFPETEVQDLIRRRRAAEHAAEAEREAETSFAWSRSNDGPGSAGYEARREARLRGEALMELRRVRRAKAEAEAIAALYARLRDGDLIASGVDARRPLAATIDIPPRLSLHRWITDWAGGQIAIGEDRIEDVRVRAASAEAVGSTAVGGNVRAKPARGAPRGPRNPDKDGAVLAAAAPRIRRGVPRQTAFREAHRELHGDYPSEADLKRYARQWSEWEKDRSSADK